MQPPKRSPALFNPYLPRRYFPLLAIIILAISSLACISAEINLVVARGESQEDTLEVSISRRILDSYLAAAKEVNQERIQDFQAAGKTPDPVELLPLNREDFGDLLKTTSYEEQGYEITSSDQGFTALKTMVLGPRQETDEWMVKVSTDPDHPEQTNYRAKIYLDLTQMEDSLFSLRGQPLPPKPDLNSSASPGSSDGSLGGIFSFLGDLTAEAEQAMAIELWYVQKAMQESDPIEYRLAIELPGVITAHKLGGQTAGSVEGNRVTLILSEADLMAHAGENLVFLVDSVVKDCSQACDKDYHLIWDGDEDSASCGCICESGWEKIEGENACNHCDTICSWSDPNLARDLENCQPNSCACTCKQGMVLNNAGTACITEAQAEIEDQTRPDSGGPSRQELGEAFLALLDPDDERDINRMPGWYLLTSTERERLLEYIEGLGLAVDRSQLIVNLGPDQTTDQRIQQINEERNRLNQITELAISQLEDQISDRRRVQEVIIKEIGGNSSLGGMLVKLPGWYQNLQKTPRDLATEYVKDLMTGEVKKRILEETHGASPATYADAAAELVKQIPYLATNSSVDDYYLYKELYRANCGGGCQSEDDARLAHEMALESLQQKVGPGRVLWSSPGEAYDRAFWTLNITLGK